MADVFDEVFAKPMEAVEPVPSQEPEAAVEPTPETVEEPTPQTQPEAVEQPQQDRAGYVPIDAMLTEREKRQGLERELQQLREAQQKPQEVPDPFDDPAGYQRHFEAQLDQRLQAQRADMSYQFAVREHGKDKVEEARAWAMERAKNDPVFNNQVGVVFQTEASPVDWVVQQHKRDAMLSEIGNRNMDDFVRDYLAKNPGLVASAAPAAATPVAVTPAPKPAMPPKSIASDATPAAAAPNANPMAAMDALFTR